MLNNNALKNKQRSARNGETSWDLGDYLVEMFKFMMRVGLFIMNLAAISMGVLVLEV